MTTPADLRIAVCGLLTASLLCSCAADDGVRNLFPASSDAASLGDGGLRFGFGDVTTSDSAPPGDFAPDAGPPATDAAADNPAAADEGSDLGPDTAVPDAPPTDAGPEPPPPPLPLAPCAAGSCWQTAITAPACGASAVPEDFSTGKYNVHAYTTLARADVPLKLRLQRTGGDWLPALVVVGDGVVLSDGVTTLSAEGLEVVVLADGGDGAEASVQITAAADLPLVVYVTAWHVVNGDFTPPMPTAATYTLRARELCESPGGLIAPDGALPGELFATEDPMTVAVGSGGWGPPVRVDAAATEHIGFRLDFSPSGAAVDLEVLAWDGQAATSLAVTNEGPGLRVLAARDPDQGRTFWARAKGGVSSATMTVTRTPIADVPPCPGQCGTLLQLPLPVDAPLQGYDMPWGVTFRYQFGRRDVLTAIFFAGRRMADLGYAPFTLKDLSKWDGNKPPGHETHTQGYHADISLYDGGGQAVWKILCAGSSAKCTGGASDFGAEPMALVIGAFFESGVVSSIYLDNALIGPLLDAADLLLLDGLLTSDVHAILNSNALRHVDYHHHHFHIRADGK